ncbi:MAG: (d)CMP kinase [Candidatus Omnitrophica bacterium]|jgi:cytidylate kinase|nr:(d)CMP kinase [Candidatus Omnitrophota bacterium]
MIVAIDGPAGSGKTTIAKLLSKKLNISYLDTGATYRALTLKALEGGIDLKDASLLAQLAANLNLKLDGQKTYLDGKDVSEEIRTPLIDKNISIIVAHPKVRSVMVSLQRAVAKGKDFVVEGRDITTVVFPNAEFKFYLDADSAIRAERRFRELEAKGMKIDFTETEKDLRKRDDADKKREVGALTLSSDATYIDTTKMSIEEVINTMVAYIENRKNNK